MKKQSIFWYLKRALPFTIPVLTGYLFMGVAFGMFLASGGLSPWHAFLMGIIVFAGSMQFVLVGLLTGGASVLYAFFMTLMVNARHLFYSVSMLERFKTFGKKKPYMIYSLTDEMFSLLCGTRVPDDVEEESFFFAIAMLCHSYWVGGSVLGAVLGELMNINMKGIDFVMPTLFTVIFIDQWRSTKIHTPTLMGLGATLLCLLFFSKTIFIVPSMALILLLLIVYRKTYLAKEARLDA